MTFATRNSSFSSYTGDEWSLSVRAPLKHWPIGLVSIPISAWSFTVHPAELLTHPSSVRRIGMCFCWTPWAYLYFLADYFFLSLFPFLRSWRRYSVPQRVGAKILRDVWYAKSNPKRLIHLLSIFLTSLFLSCLVAFFLSVFSFFFTLLNGDRAKFLRDQDDPLFAH